MSEIIETALDLLQNLANGWLGKTLLALVTVIFAGIYVPVSALMGLVILDTLLGTWKAYKSRTLTYRNWRNKTLTKFFVYFALIIAARLVELLLGGGGDVLGVKPSQITLVFLGVTEFSSIIRNGSSLIGKSINPFRLKRVVEDLKNDLLDDKDKQESKETPDARSQ